jgi:hypothetical protein
VKSSTRGLFLIALLLWVDQARATTSYVVQIHPPGTQGLACKLALDLSHVDGSVENRAEVSAFTHDGISDSATVDGGPGVGDLLNNANPAALTSLEGQYFANSLTVPFKALGTTLSFQLDVTEDAAPSGAFADECSMYFLRADGLPYPTSDGLGTDALFTIDITGVAGGELSVFSPMTFSPPNTLILGSNVSAVSQPLPLRGRLRFRSVAPNPSPGGVIAVFEIPQPGGHLQVDVFDAAGRRVAKAVDKVVTEGMFNFRWDGRDLRGQRAAAGVYLMQARLGAQTVVRRLVLNP